MLDGRLAWAALGVMAQARGVGRGMLSAAGWSDCWGEYWVGHLRCAGWAGGGGKGEAPRL